MTTVLGYKFSCYYSIHAIHTSRTKHTSCLKLNLFVEQFNLTLSFAPMSHVYLYACVCICFYARVASDTFENAESLQLFEQKFQFVLDFLSVSLSLLDLILDTPFDIIIKSEYLNAFTYAIHITLRKKKKYCSFWPKNQEIENILQVNMQDVR